MTNNKTIEPAKPRIGTSVEDLSDLTKYILLPGREHGAFSYPDLLVEKTLSHRGKSWYECHAALHQESSFMLTIRQFVDLLSLLRSGKAVDGTGRSLSSKEREAFFKDYSNYHSEEVGEWRVGERLDARFTCTESGGFYSSFFFDINYNHRIDSDGKLKYKTERIGSSTHEGKKCKFFNTEEYKVGNLQSTIVLPFDEYLQSAGDTGLLSPDYKLDITTNGKKVHNNKMKTQGRMYFTSVAIDHTTCFYFPQPYNEQFYGHITCLGKTDSEVLAIGVRRAREK